MKTDEKYTVTPFRADDVEPLVFWMKDKTIHDNTLMIPHPYTQKNGIDWIEFCMKNLNTNGKHLNFAIRDSNGRLIGGIGFSIKNHPALKHKAELGYWLGEPYRNKGIITNAVKQVCEYAFKELEISRITAYVFAENPASEKVLLKAGFQQEGYLKKNYFKNGEYRDGKLFALLNEEVETA
jgi:[ribosomal protein S5]-alanine N-acetyltransferase